MASFFAALLETPEKLSAASKYAVANGVVYFISGACFVIWPGAVQTLLLDAPFTGNEAALVRALGLAVATIGWLYIFGGRSGARQLVAASVINRLLFVPIVLVPLILDGVFPHLLSAFAVSDPCLAVGAWLMLRREKSYG